MLSVAVERAAGTKCERCWKYTDDVGSDPRFPTVCAACAAAVEETSMAKSLKFVGQALWAAAGFCPASLVTLCLDREAPTCRAHVPTSRTGLRLDRPQVVVERSVSFYDDIKVIPGLFDIVHSENRGVAFGVFNDSDSQWRTALLVALSIAAVIWSRHAMALPPLELCHPGPSRWSWAARPAICSTASISGRVTDFLLFYIGDLSVALVQRGRFGHRDRLRPAAPRSTSPET